MGKVAGFANEVGTLFTTLAPEALTQEFSKADRRGRIYVDTGRNGYSATPLRRTPCAQKGCARVCSGARGKSRTWRGGPRHVHVDKHAGSVEAVGDVWADMKRQRPVAQDVDREVTAYERRSLSCGPWSLTVLCPRTDQGQSTKDQGPFRSSPSRRRSESSREWQRPAGFLQRREASPLISRTPACSYRAFSFAGAKPICAVLSPHIRFAAFCPPAAIYGAALATTGFSAAGRITYFAVGTST